jgi:phosphate transport system permease protein
MTALLDAPVGAPPYEPPPMLEPERRRRTSGLRRNDVLAMGGALIAALCLTALLFSILLPFSGGIGFIVTTYVAFLALYTLLISLEQGGPIVRDKLAAVVIQSLAFLMLAALVFVVSYTLYRGYQALTYTNFFTQDLAKAGPLDPLTLGGIKHAIVGTLIMIAIALLITVPLGITCAVFLNEVPGKFSRLVRTIAEAMTALPSIVAGLFIYATFLIALGNQKSGLAASLALSVMMLPIIIRASDVVLRLVPGTLKEASLAMGAGQWRTVWHVVLPTSRSGLTTAVILGTARGIGETSPVLLTAGYTAAFNANPFEGPMVSLPLLVFELVKSPENTQIMRGFGTAATLMLLVLVLFVLARIIGGRGPGELSKGQRRRRTRRSARDLERMVAAHGAAAAATVPASQALSDPSDPTDSRRSDLP